MDEEIVALDPRSAGKRHAARRRTNDNESQRSGSARRRHRHGSHARSGARAASTSPSKWKHTLKLTRRAAGRHRDSQDRHAVSGGDGAARARRRRHPDGRGGPAGVRQCAAREAAGKRPARHSQGAGRLCEPAPGARVRVAAGFFAPEEPPGGRHRHDHRPRTDGRDLLRNSARHHRKTARKSGRSIP